jgi:AraC-like DNA-binding protein
MAKGRFARHYPWAMVMRAIRYEAAHTVPLFLVSQLAELVQRWHIPVEELETEPGLVARAAQEPLARFPVPRMNELLERARTLTGEPGLGYYLGLAKRASGYGTLGFAALSASSVREALELAVKFGAVHSTAISLDLRVRGDIAILALEENAELGPVRDLVIISMMLGLQTIFCALTGQSPDSAADLALPEPAYQARFKHLVPKWRFGQPAHRLVCAASLLDSPIATANPTGLRVAQTLCENALDELSFDGELVQRVRGLLETDGGGFRSLDEVASCVHVSQRTLKRRLAAQGVTFSTLAERERRDKALVLLRSSRLSVADIAGRLDYSTASTFVRAFRRWTGTTPAVFRRRLSSGATTRQTVS